MTQRWSHRRILCGLLVVAFVVRLGLFLVFAPWRGTVQESSVLHSDARFYYTGAVNMLAQHVYSYDTTPPFAPTNYWPPGFSFWMAGWFLFCGLRPWCVLLANIAVDCATVLLVFLFAAQFHSSTRAGLFAALMTAFSPVLIVATQQCVPGTLYVLCTTVFLMLWHGYATTPRAMRAATCGLMLGVAVLIKPVLLYFPAVLVAVLAVEGVVTGRLGQRLCHAALMCLVFVATLSPYLLRNRLALQTWSFTTLDGGTLVDFSAAHSVAQEFGTDFMTARGALFFALNQRYNLAPTCTAKTYPRFATNVPWAARLVPQGYMVAENMRVTLHTEHEYNHAQKELFAAYLRIHWRDYVVSSVKGSVRTIFYPPWQETLRMMMPGLYPQALDLAKATIKLDSGALQQMGYGRVIVAVSLAVVMTLYAVGVGCAAFAGSLRAIVQRRSGLVTWTMILLAGYVCAVQGPNAEPRFSLPFVPVMSAFAAGFMLWLHDVTKARTHRRERS